MTSLIHVQHLTKIYESYKKTPGLFGSLKNLFHREKIKVEAVKSVSFDIAEGEFIGFVGPNGAGKTTTLKMLSGILHPTSGEVKVLGHIPYQREHEYQRQFSLVMGQKNMLFWDVSPMETFLLNQAIYEIPEDMFRKNLDELSALLDVKEILNVQVRKLSLGQRMKCELIAALLHSPKVLFLDEPTIGLDVVSQRAIRDFLKEYNLRTRATILLTSHYMQDIRRLCERVIIINHGQILYDGSYPELYKKYADSKTVEMTFSEELPLERLAAYGDVTNYRGFSAALTIPRLKSAELTSKILSELPVDDITIHDRDIEEIISEIFSLKAVR